MWPFFWLGQGLGDRGLLLPLPLLVMLPRRNPSLHVAETYGTVWSKEDVTSMEEDQVRECLNKSDMHESMGLDGKHPRKWREVAYVTVIISEVLRQWLVGEVPETGRKHMFSLLPSGRAR